MAISLAKAVSGTNIFVVKQVDAYRMLWGGPVTPLNYS